MASFAGRTGRLATACGFSPGRFSDNTPRSLCCHPGRPTPLAAADGLLLGVRVVRWIIRPATYPARSRNREFQRFADPARRLSVRIEGRPRPGAMRGDVLETGSEGGVSSPRRRCLVKRRTCLQSAVRSGLSSIGRFNSERRRGCAAGRPTTEGGGAHARGTLQQLPRDQGVGIGEGSNLGRADEVLIDVHAASVSFADYLMICGGYRSGQPSLRTGNGRCRGCRRLR